VFEQIHPNVARLIGSPHTPQQEILAAVWAGGDGTVASHRSDALLWGVERPNDDPVDIILPHRSRHSLPHGVVVHRPRDLRELRPIIRQGVPCVSPLRMLCDLGAVDPEGVSDALETLLTTRVVSWGAVMGALSRHAKKGHAGIGALRRACDAWQIEGKPIDSKLEKAMDALVRTYRLPHVTFHAIVAGYQVDFLVDGTRIVLECDGYESHGMKRDQFEFDRLRGADVTAAGYVIVHFTWRQIQHEPGKVAQRIERNLQQWAPEVLAVARSF